MSDYRIKSHPILIDESEAPVPFFWQDKLFYAKPNEMISSALIAQGIQVFRHHVKDHSPQGIFCCEWAVFTMHGDCRWSACKSLHDGCQTRHESSASGRFADFTRNF